MEEAVFDSANHRFIPRRSQQFVEQVEKALKVKNTSEPSVWISTVETHDGEVCACLPGAKEYKVGDKMTLTHTCVDGRVDVLEAEIVRFTNLPTPVHHGTVD